MSEPPPPSTETESPPVQNDTAGDDGPTDDLPPSFNFNEEQKAFLGLRIADFKVSRANKRTQDFWARTFTEWFSKYPLPDGSTIKGVETTLRQKVKQWFNNHTRVTANTRQVLNLNQGKRMKRPATFQAFSSLYYDGPNKKVILPKENKCFHDIVEGAWLDNCKDKDLYDTKGRPAKMPVSFLNAIAKTVYDNQPPEIKEEIEEYRNQQVASKNEEGEEESTELMTARHYDKAIGSLPISLDQARQQIMEATGFVSFTMVAGPNPSEGGNILSYVISEGKTPEGCKFEQFCNNFEKAVVQQFVKFANLVFPPSERVRRSLPGTECLRKYDEPADKIKATHRSAPSPSLASSSSAGPSNRTDKTTLRALEREARESDSEDDPGAEASARTTPAPSRTGYKSQYEVERDKNIADNRALLAGLGLDKPFFEKPKPKPRQPRKKKEKCSAPVRKSSRFVASPSEEPEAAETSSSTNVPAVVSTTPADAPTAPAASVEVPAAPTTPADAPTASAASVEVPAAPPTPADAPTAPDPSVGVPAVPTPPVEQALDLMQVDSVNVEEEEDDTSPLLLEEAPEWLRDGAKDLWKYSRDVKWRQVIQKFVLFEKSLGFLEGRIATHTLASGKNRPKEIGPWVRSGRSAPPSIKNLNTFTEQWWKWYVELQPAARRSADGSLQYIETEESHWQETRKGTINGFYSILASLGWWVKAVKDVKQDHALVSAIADIDWVLGSMTRVGTSKRTSPETDSVDERNTKRARSS